MKKDNGTLTFLPFGGTANRMRAMASAVNLSRHTGVEIKVVWFKDWAMLADYSELFEPINIPGISIREAKAWEYYTMDRPRKKNFFLPSPFLKLNYDEAMSEKDMFRNVDRKYDFEAWAKGKNNWIPCCMQFGEFEDYDALIREIFHPVESVRKGVKEYTDQFSDYTIGLHIRRTDNVDSIQKSPITVFLTAVDKELSQHQDLKVFLATDDEPTKEAMKQRYGNIIINPTRLPHVRA